MDKPRLWKADIEKSVDFYNDWFIKFAPKAYKEVRSTTILKVEDAFGITKNFSNSLRSQICGRFYQHK